MKISENTAVSMPMRNLLSIIGAVCVGVWFAFGVIERLNNIETQQTLIEKDLEKAVEFSIKWPRGDLGSLPADSEQFMLIEHMAGQIEKIQEAIEEGMHNKVNIDFLKEQMTKIQADVEKLKDGLRQANGNHK
jgi:hypothetical protein|tara:strand:+ start:181 stop:579 length:399 start_codon:yes stop_codon:yes gene_type:complete